MAVSKRKGKDAPPERQRRQRLVDKWHRQLLKNPTALRQFKEYRLLTTNTIKQFRIGYTKNGFPEEGWDGPVYTLPISDEQGDPITVKLFHWDHEPKMRWLRAKRPGEDSNELFLKRNQKTSLFPTSSIQDADIVCEGEWDCLMLHQMGLSAVTNTTGAKTWKASWSHQLRGRDRIVLLYDDDEDGRVGRAKAGRSLIGVGTEVHKIDLAEKWQGFDITDFVRAHGLAEATELLTKMLADAPVFNPFDVTDDPSLIERAYQSVLSQQGMILANTVNMPAVLGETWDDILKNHQVHEAIEGTSIPVGGVAAFFGPTGSFKSITVQDLSWHLASNGSWHHRKGWRQRAIIFAFVLEGAEGLSGRQKAWRLLNPQEDYPRPGRRWIVEKQIGDLAHPGYRKQVVDRLSNVGTDIVVIDTYGLAITRFKGGNGNENTDANAFVLTLKEISAAVQLRTGRPLTWILVHHSGWEVGRPRGSSQFAQACDLVLEFKPDDRVQNRSYVTVYKPSRDLAHLFQPFTVKKVTKRWGQKPEQASFAIVIEETPPAVGGEGELEPVEVIYQALKRTRQKTSAIVKKAGLHRTTVHRYLKELNEYGFVQYEQDGQTDYWWLTGARKKAIAPVLAKKRKTGALKGRRR